MNLRINPGLEVWLGILPPMWDEDDFDDWEDKQSLLEKKKKIVKIRKSDFRHVFQTFRKGPILPHALWGKLLKEGAHARYHIRQTKARG